MGTEVDMFLELDGIKGEATDAKYKDKMNILSWSWGLTNSGTFQAGGARGGGAGKASFQDINVTKFVDKASPELMLAVANGKHIKAGKIVVRKAGEKPLEYLKVSFDNVRITSYSTSGAGEALIAENLSLNFQKVKVEYTEQDDKGAAAGTVDFAWNIAENQKG